jgi:Tyrosine-protein kinase ephrin type A/B receptor-like
MLMKMVVYQRVKNISIRVPRLNINIMAMCIIYFCQFTTVSATGDGFCSSCPPNNYCSDSGINNCPSNSVSSEGSNFLTDCSCKAGYVGVNGAMCYECGENFYCVGGESVRSCPNHSESPHGSNSSLACICVTGWYGDPGGECLECEPGFWCDRGVKDSCPTYTWSDAGSGALEKCTCVAGYTANSNGVACTACVAGTYKVNPGSAVCTLCATGLYSTEEHAVTASTCASCPANTRYLPYLNYLE